jgi:hypothetical protein
MQPEPDPDDIAEALAYALRFDERGKPQRAGAALIAGLAAGRLADHLREAGFVIVRDLSARAHSAG